MRKNKVKSRFTLPVLPGARKRRTKKWGWLAWLACAGVLYGAHAYLGGSSGLIQYWRLKLLYSKREKEILLLQSRQDSLQQVINLLQSDTTYIEKVARERFNMGRSDETIFTVVKQP